MDLSDYIKRPVTKTFHGQPKQLQGQITEREGSQDSSGKYSLECMLGFKSNSDHFIVVSGRLINLPVAILYL